MFIFESPAPQFWLLHSLTELSELLSNVSLCILDLIDLTKQYIMFGEKKEVGE
jgi:hypothetical protein